MCKNIFDSHAHYDDERFNEDRYDVLERLFKNGVCGIVNCGSDLKTSITSINLSAKYPLVFAAAGVHPHEAESMGAKELEIIRDLLGEEKCVAVGEIGLDYHYDFSPREVQLDTFEKQLIMANELQKPVIIHDREAHEDTMRLLKKHRPRGVVHCFSGSAEMAKEVLKIGMYIGIGGAVTFKNAKKPVAVVSEVPWDRLLIETDCPYMTPVPHRGERNDSSFIPFTAQKIAEIRGVTAQEVLDITAKNAKELFNV